MADKSNRDSNAPADEFAQGVKSIVVSGVANRAGSSSPPPTALQHILHQVCQQVCKPLTPRSNRGTTRMGAAQTPRRSGRGQSSTSSDSSGGYVTSKDKGKGLLTSASSININSVPNGVSAGHSFCMGRSSNIIVAMDNPLRVIPREGGQEVISNSPGPLATGGRGRNAVLAANAVISKAPKPKRKRASKKTPTQVIHVSSEEFRPTVQRITGCRLPEAQLVRPQPERPQAERQQAECPQAERQQPERSQAERQEPELPKPEHQQPSEHKQAERQEPERPKANSVPIRVGMVADPPARPDSSSTPRIRVVPSPSPIVSGIVSSRVPEPSVPYDSYGSDSSSSILQYTLCDNSDSIYKAFGFPEGHRGILDDDLEQASDDSYSLKPVHEDGAGTSTPTAVVDDVHKKEYTQREHKLSGSAMAMPDSLPRSMFHRELDDLTDTCEMERIFDTCEMEEFFSCYENRFSNSIYGFE